jgi:nucleotidyltransferase-like protein
MSSETDFADLVARRLAAIPSVLAVTLGGSRADGTNRPDSDWDFGLYYRGNLNSDDIRALGWSGQVFAPGEWGGGVMNGGAWLRVDAQRVDIIYRDLDTVEHWMAEAQQGRFKVERLPFYLAGIPTYVLVGELALCDVLIGDLPRPKFPQILKETAPPWWRDASRLSLDDAEQNYVPKGDVIGCAGSLARAVIEAAHGRLAARGIWALNEKRIVEQAGFTELQEPFAYLGATPADLGRALRTVRAVILG